MTYSGIATFLPSYGISKNITNMGLFFTIYAVTLFLTRPITGKLADKIGTLKVVLPGMIFLMTALFLLVKSHSIYDFLAASVFYGIGFGSIQPILNALVVSLAPAEKKRRCQRYLSCSYGFRHGHRFSRLGNYISKNRLRLYLQLFNFFSFLCSCLIPNNIFKKYFTCSE